MKKMIMLGASVLCLAAAPAMAQVVQEQTTVVKQKSGSGAAAGAVTGAATGAVVAGPVGAAVGAAAGAVVGHSADPPKEVRTYVTTQQVAPVTYGQPVVVGHTIDGDVAWLSVPNYPKYSWAYLDGHRVLVDAETHTVVAVY
jgi:hypothetical protein